MKQTLIVALAGVIMALSSARAADAEERFTTIFDGKSFTGWKTSLVSQGLHAYLKEKNLPHIWHVDEHAHDFQHWKKGLYNFAQLIFKPRGEL